MTADPTAPRLIGVGGASEGQTFVLSDAVCVIGRDFGCHVQVRDVTVSRRHSELRREGQKVVLRDLDSRSGTFVNGHLSSQRTLAHGDLIQVGSAVFLFAAERDRADRSAIADSGAMGASTIARTLDDSRYLSAGRKRPTRAEIAARPGAITAALIALCRDSQRAHTPDAVAEIALAKALALLPADRGCVLLVDMSAGVVDALGAGEVPDLQPSAVALRGSDTAAPFAVSKPLIGRALTERVALLSADVASDFVSPASDAVASPPPQALPASLDEAQVRSLLCAPLVIPGRGDSAKPGRDPAHADADGDHRAARSSGNGPNALPAPDLAHRRGRMSDVPVGVLYLDAARASALTDADLELAVAIAALVSLALESALHLARLRSENHRLRADEGATDELIGHSPAMTHLRQLIERIGPSDATVLIRGPSGTGKELCARALHRASGRAQGPFVAVNCAVLSEALLESELFGHERGAFTGASARKLGRIELAHGGTLFLDEVGEIPIALQAKLLRVLQEREFERVGGTRPIRVDVRIVAATNRDLEAGIAAGSFRDDLFYRLNVIALTVPPLRARGDDVILLARHFAGSRRARASRRVIGIAPAARAALLAYSWPGNVRQLENAIEHAVVLGSDEIIHRDDLPDEIIATSVAQPSAPASRRESTADPDSGDSGEGDNNADAERARPADRNANATANAIASTTANGDASRERALGFQEQIVATKKALITDAYRRAGGDHQEAARLLDIHANSLHRLIRNLGLKATLGK